jgi:hypothetical protein
MKRIVLLIAATTIFASQLIAKDSDPTREKLIIGFKAGMNYSNVYDAQGEEFNTDAGVGFAGGAFVSIPIGKFLGVQPEFLFSQKGFTATGIMLGSPYHFTRRSNYLDIPLFVSLKPSDFVTILAGPQFSFLVKQKDVFTYSTTSSVQEQEFKNDNIRRNTLCFVGGLDFNFNHFVLGARAGWDVQNNKGDGTSSTPRYKNVWLQATVGIRIY